MSLNPYAPPKTNVERPEGSFEPPRGVLENIRNAAIAGLISGSITLVFTLIALASKDVTGFIDAWSLIDVALIFGLTFGIYKKSRTCAVAMLVYFVISKIIIYQTTGKMTGIVLSLVFVYFFAVGVQATFAYHKLRKQHFR